MTYRLSTKHCTVAEEIENVLQKQTAGVGLLLSHIDQQLSTLDIVLKGHQHAPWYVCTVTVPLPQQRLSTSGEGVTMEAAIQQSFIRLRKEIQTYRGKHFPGDSTYADHRTIRSPSSAPAGGDVA